MRVSFLLIISFLFLNVSGKTEWEKKKDKKGVVVYTRAAENAPMDEFKGITTLPNIRLVAVLDVIMDIENYPKWIPNCLKAETLLKNEKYHSLHYLTMKAPWPLENRDAVYEMSAILSNNNTVARINIEPRGDYIEEKKQFVRLYKGSGFWELEEVEENKLKVTYQFQGDPGGKIPAWLANSFVVTNPYQTLINLKELLRK